jgi:hypothetical protein
MEQGAGFKLSSEATVLYFLSPVVS